MPYYRHFETPGNDVSNWEIQKRLQIEKIHSKTHIIHWTEHTQNDTITARNDHFFYIFMTTICIF